MKACRDLFPKLQGILNQHEIPEHAAITALSHKSESDIDLDAHIREGLDYVANVLVQALANSSAWLPAVLDLLANATREQPLWRPLFGHPTAVSAGSSPSCILEAAVRVLHNESTGNESPSVTQDDVLRPALRLVANCCADDDLSRSVLINADGVEDLKRLVLRKRALDLLLPTIYNVCVDFDQIATDSHGEPLILKDLDTSTELTVAEQALGGPLAGSAASMSSVQLFLGLSGSRVASLDVAADLAEMASRPALFGARNIISEDDSGWSSKSHSLLSDILTIGRSMVEEDEDILPAIFQTLLNVLSQKEFQTTLAESSGLIPMLTKIFEVVPEGNIESRKYADSLLQIVYAVSALPEFADTCTPDSSTFSSLLEQLLQLSAATNQPQTYQTASLIVFLANSLTTPDRIAQSLSHTASWPQILADSLKISTNPIITVPGLDLASRLALDPTGQQSLLQTNILTILTQYLQPTTQPKSPQTHTLTIHRESITLTRLLIKSLQSPLPADPLQPSTPQTYPPTSPIHTRTFPPLHTLILTLSHTTLDDATKLEAGRYTVEVLRQLSTPPLQPPHQTSTNPYPHSAELPLPPLLPPILHLLTASPSHAGRVEGLFGLGLLLSRAHAEVAGGGDGKEEGLDLGVLVQKEREVVAALGGVLDASDQEENQGVVGERTGEEGTESAAGAGRVRAERERENVKMVAVQLLRVLRVGGGEGEGEGARAVEGERSDELGRAGDAEGRSDREVLIAGLEELMGRLGIQV